MSSPSVNPALSSLSDCLYRVSIKAVVCEDQKILFTKEKKHGWWSLPGGGLDYGETIVQALTRELSEELGLLETDVSLTLNPLHLDASAVIDGIPKLAVFMKVQLNQQSFKLGPDIEAAEWLSINDLETRTVSPTIRPVVKQLFTSVSR